jgi:hypothetical protein
MLAVSVWMIPAAACTVIRSVTLPGSSAMSMVSVVLTSIVSPDRETVLKPSFLSSSVYAPRGREVTT